MQLFLVEQKEKKKQLDALQPQYFTLIFRFSKHQFYLAFHLSRKPLLFAHSLSLRQKHLPHTIQNIHKDDIR